MADRCPDTIAEVQVGVWASGRDIGLPAGSYFGLECPECHQKRWARPGGTVQKHPDGLARCNDCRLAREKVDFSKLLKGGRRR